MKKLAIKSFLAVTAMAWSAQSPASPTFSEELREAERGHPPGLYRSGEQDTLEGAGAAMPGRVPAALFSPSERGLIRSWLRELAQAGTTGHPELIRGQPLEFVHLRQGRALPQWLRQAIRSGGDEVVDVLLHGQVVRLQRPDNLVIDLV